MDSIVYPGRAEAKQLIASAGAFPDASLYTPVPLYARDYFELYRFPDGRVLALNKLDKSGPSVLYPSVDSFYSRWQQIPEPRHQLAGYSIFTSQFASHVDDLINQLANTLEIDAVRLDRSLESLEIVDKKLDQFIIDHGREVVLNQLLPQLIAYTGAVLNQQQESSWLIERSTDDESIWCPNLIHSDGKVQVFYTLVWCNYQDVDRPATPTLASVVYALRAARTIPVEINMRIDDSSAERR